MQGWLAQQSLRLLYIHRAALPHLLTHKYAHAHTPAAAALAPALAADRQQADCLITNTQTILTAQNPAVPPALTAPPAAPAHPPTAATRLTCSRCCPVFRRPFLLNSGMAVLPTSSSGWPSLSSYTDRDRKVSQGRSRYCSVRVGLWVSGGGDVLEGGGDRRQGGVGTRQN